MMPRSRCRGASTIVSPSDSCLSSPPAALPTMQEPGSEFSDGGSLSRIARQVTARNVRISDQLEREGLDSALRPVISQGIRGAKSPIRSLLRVTIGGWRSILAVSTSYPGRAKPVLPHLIGLPIRLPAYDESPPRQRQTYPRRISSRSRRSYRRPHRDSRRPSQRPPRVRTAPIPAARAASARLCPEA